MTNHDDPIEVTENYIVTKSLTTSFALNRQNQFVKVEVVDGLMPGETAEDLGDRLTILALRDLTTTVDSFRRTFKTHIDKG